MATRKVYAIRYKQVTYSGGEPFSDKFAQSRYEELVDTPESPRDIIEVVTLSYKKAQNYVKEAQKLYQAYRCDDTESAKLKGLRPTYYIAIRFYYIGQLTTI